MQLPALPMATMRQIGSFGHLPASNDLLLEIQVSRFINEFLFSPVEDCKAPPISSSPPRHVDVEKCQLPSSILDPNGRFGSEGMSLHCTPPHVSQQNAEVYANVGSLTSVGNSESLLKSLRSVHGGCLDSSALPEEFRISVNEQERGLGVGRTELPGAKALSNSMTFPASKASATTSVFCTSHNPSVQGEPEQTSSRGDVADRVSSHLLQDYEAVEAMEAGIKPSCRKPPRPPRSAKLPAEGGLTRSTSEASLLLLSTRRAKTERKRKMAAASSASTTSIWALIFTLCFAVAMVVQGFLSQGSQSIVMGSNNAYSPSNSYASSSMKRDLPASGSEVKPLDVQIGAGLDTHNPALRRIDVGRETYSQPLPTSMGSNSRNAETWAT